MSRRVTTKKIKEKVLDIPKEKIAEYQEAFNLFDKKHTGSISAVDIFKIMKNYGNSIPLDQIKEMVNRIDESGDGELDFDEFISFMQEIEVEEEVIDEEDPVVRAFMFFDKNKTGKITNQEFKYILLNIGEVFSLPEVQRVFKESNLEDDKGEFDYREFVAFWRKLTAESK